MGILSNDQRRGILNLTPKANKDLRFLRNWRPISILNTDYKILAKVLASRLQQVLPVLVNKDQVGYIKGRYIGENIRMIEDVMNYTELKHLPGYIILIDFEKAFDSVSWDFLFSTLSSLNFGENFIKWIKIMYTNIESCITNNGYSSRFFQLSRGIRQGCPLSALLFILVAEIMAIKIRGQDNIKGIKCEKIEFKICQLADDTTIFVSDYASLSNVISILQKFELCSGLRMNIDKTEVIPVGTNKNKSLKLPKPLNKIRINNGMFKTLGIWFSYDQNNAIKLNYSEKLIKMQTILNMWKTRSLSWKGKVLITKTLVIPQLIYLFSVTFCPPNILKTVDQMLYDFVWDGKPAKIKKSTLISTYSMGGLKMPDVYGIHAASKIKWIKKLYCEQDDKLNKLRCLSKYLLNINGFKMCHKLPASYKDKCLSIFYRQVFSCWQEFYCRAPELPRDIYKEFIFDNKFICSDNKPLNAKVLNLPENIVNDLRIYDILTEQGHIMEKIDFINKTGINISSMSYNKIIASIPKEWKDNIKSKEIQNIHKSNVPILTVKGKKMEISKVKNKVLYWCIINCKLLPPTAIDTWVELYPFLDVFPWYKIFNLAHKIVPDSYLHTFQYKILTPSPPKERNSPVPKEKIKK